jgi:hypothetical protein
MAIVHLAARDEFCTSLHLAKEATSTRVVPSTATKTEALWLIWLVKCTKWEINPIQDPSSMHTANYLAAFAHKVRTGKITPSGKPCRLGKMETTPFAIGQTIALLEPKDHNPHQQPYDKLIFALKCQFQSYEKEDPSPTCIGPLPVELIELAVQACHASNTERDTCIASMIIIVFFNVALMNTQWLLTTSPSSCQNSNSTKTTNLYPHTPLSFCTQQTFLPLPLTLRKMV